jgi:hypothetical protein
MTTPITLIHTAEIHRESFSALAARLAPDAKVMQHVRVDWLERARKHGVRQGLIDELAELIHAAPGPAICTCTTLGEAAAALGAIRVDAPMMAEAATAGGPILMVYALESTLKPSLAALEQALADAEHQTQVLPLFIGQFWPLFEAGEVQAFTACVAGAVRDAVEHNDVGCVVLAQASMAAAAPLLANLGKPVFTSPESALRAALTT